MKILLIVSEMATISGSPMYNYTLALELKKQGHQVDVYSTFANNEIRANLLRAGVRCLSNITDSYELTIVSQNKYEALLSNVKTDYLINVVHSEYEAETPIKNANHYIAIRPSIKEHLITEHAISEQDISVIYNGIDFERFNASKRKRHEGTYTKVVMPCSIHPFREKMIRYYTDKASEDFRVYMYGLKGILGFEKTVNEWVFLNPPKFDIENYIADADIVAGVLYGRVNLEAHAMGIKSVIHNPTDPTDNYIFSCDDFETKHNVSNVVSQIIALVPDKTQKVFTQIYKENLWNDAQSKSGTGSNLEQTKQISKEIPKLIKKYGVKSMLDVPCGDYYWMSKVKLPCEYTGGDIVPELIKENKAAYPSKDFRVIDLITSTLPQAELIFCRDCLVHLPYEMIFKALENIKKSGAKYLLTTSFPEHTNKDIPLGGWRPINLNIVPFNLKHVDIINEGCTENDGIFADKSLILIEL